MINSFIKERTEIGEGMVAKVYSWNGFAYKCFHDGYPKEWIDYEYSQQNEVCKSGLPIPHYYESEFQGTIKMDLICGCSMFEKIKSLGKDVVMDDFITWFKKIHEIKHLKLHHVTKYLGKLIQHQYLKKKKYIQNNVYQKQKKKMWKMKDSVTWIIIH